MKITLSQLKRIIKEEVTAVKQVGSALPKGRVRSNVPKMSAESLADQRMIEEFCAGAVSSMVMGFDTSLYNQLASMLVDRGAVDPGFSAEELVEELSMDSAQVEAVDNMTKALIVYTKSAVAAMNKLYPEGST